MRSTHYPDLVKHCLHSLLHILDLPDVGLTLSLSCPSAFLEVQVWWSHRSFLRTVRSTWVHGFIRILVRWRLFLHSLGETSILFCYWLIAFLDHWLHCCSATSSAFASFSCWAISFLIYAWWHILQTSRSFLASRSLIATARLRHLVVLITPKILRVLLDTLRTRAIHMGWFLSRTLAYLAPRALLSASFTLCGFSTS